MIEKILNWPYFWWVIGGLLLLTWKQGVDNYHKEQRLKKWFDPKNRKVRLKWESQRNKNRNKR